MIYLTQLVEELNRLAPLDRMTATAKEIRTVTTAGEPVSLSEKPEFGTIKLYHANGSEITDFTANYITGTVTAIGLEDDDQFIANYRYSAAKSVTESALREVGRRLALRTVADITFVDGIATLPSGFVSLEWMKQSDTSDVDLLGGGGNCSDNGDCYQCGTCRIFVRGGEIILNPVPVVDVDIQICYLSNYEVQNDGSIPGLTRDRADLVILKALSLAYSYLGSSSVFSNPVSTTSQSSSGGSSSGSYNVEREEGLIETQFRIGDEMYQKRWEAKSDTADFTNTQAKTFVEMASHYERMFEDRIVMIDGIAKQNAPRGGYRKKMLNL